MLAETWPVMLDFDGPVTYLIINGRNRIVANHMRQVLPAGMDIPVDLRNIPDPLVILSWTALHTPMNSPPRSTKPAPPARSPQPGFPNRPPGRWTCCKPAPRSDVPLWW